MALELNTASVKLGDVSNSVKPEYTSLYLDFKDASGVPANCELPEAVVAPLNLEGLEKLNALCKFAFPPVFLTPPIYNEPPPEACESFTATLNVAMLNAAASSELAIDSTSVTECGLDISGFIDVIACEAFDASTELKVPSAMEGSTFDAFPRGTPDCGVDLKLDLKLEVCETAEFAVDATVSPGNINTASSYYFEQQEFTPSPESEDCGGTIKLDLKLPELCETAEFAVDATVSPGNINTASRYYFEQQEFTPSPESEDCGGTIKLDLKLPELCETAEFAVDATVSPGNINTASSYYFEQQEFTPSPESEDCGGTIKLDLKLPELCETAEFAVDATVSPGNINTASSYYFEQQEFTPSPESEDCGGTIKLDLKLPELCETAEFAVDATVSPGNINTASRYYFEQQEFTPSPESEDCGGTIKLDLKLPELCETAEFDVNAKVSGTQNKISFTTQQFTPSPESEDCGGTIDLNLDLPTLCETADFDVNAKVSGTQNKISFTTQQFTPSPSDLDCGGTIDLNLDLPTLCETADFDVNAKVSGTQNKISFTTQQFTPSPSDLDCGGTIDLNLNMPTLCETAEFDVNAKVSGTQNKISFTTQQFTPSPSDLDCGGTIDLNLNMPTLCETAEFDVNAKVSGTQNKISFTTQQFTPSPSDLDCGGTIDLNLNMPTLCETAEFDVNAKVSGTQNKISFTTQQFTPSPSELDCGGTIDLNLNMPTLCETAEFDVNAKVSGTQNQISFTTQQFTPSPSDLDCGGTIDLNLNMPTMCDSFKVDSSGLKIRGAGGSLSFSADDVPNCALVVDGDLCIPTISVGTSNVTFDSPLSGNITLKISKGGGGGGGGGSSGCDYEISLEGNVSIATTSC